MKTRKLFSAFYILGLFCLLMIGLTYADVSAATTVSVGEIDYEEQYMKIYKNGNAIVYVSTDAKKTWNEVEGISYTDGTGLYIQMDISWVSSAQDVTIYLKGNSASNVISVKFPKQNASFKAKFDSVNNDFTFSGADSASQFYWRKATDYNWQRVDFDESSSSYKLFLQQVEALRFKGAKIIFRTGQIKGTSESDVGERPSKEFPVTISKYSAAPSIKLNIAKLTFNTKETIEYYDSSSGTWMTCGKNMTVGELAPSALTSGGSAKTILQFRTAATEKKAASLVSTLIIPGQRMAPSLGALGSNAEVACGENDKKFQIVFKNASATNMYEYCIERSDKDNFDIEKVTWKTIKKADPVKLSLTAVPSGSVVYVRYKGIAANVSKNISLQLPSAYATFIVQ